MKICYLTNNINPKNGWGRYASDLIYGVKSSGHDVLILKEQDDGLEGIPILKRGLGIFSSALRIKKLIKDCDIIHALDGNPFGIIAWLANIGLNKKLIISVIGSYSVASLYHWKTAFLVKRAYRKSNQIITISNFTKSEIIKRVNLENIKVINPGINFEKFYGPRTEVEEKFILSVGAVKPRKGYHISIPAFALVKKMIPDLKYKIAGSYAEDGYFKNLKKLIRDYGLENNDVEFLGEISSEELIKLYRTAKAFVLTSVNEGHHFEGFGLVFLEASAAGLPVIGTKGNGIEDAVRDGYNGILVPQNDIERTAEAVIEIEILKNKEKWQEMASSSHSWAQTHSLDNMIKSYLDIYNS